MQVTFWFNISEGFSELFSGVFDNFDWIRKLPKIVPKTVQSSERFSERFSERDWIAILSPEHLIRWRRRETPGGPAVACSARRRGAGADIDLLATPQLRGTEVLFNVFIKLDTVGIDYFVR